MAEQLATILPSPLQHKERGGKNSLPTNLPLCAHWLVHLFKLGSKDHLLVLSQNRRTKKKKQNKKNTRQSTFTDSIAVKPADYLTKQAPKNGFQNFPK